MLLGMDKMLSRDRETSALFYCTVTVITVTIICKINFHIFCRFPGAALLPCRKKIHGFEPWFFLHKVCNLSLCWVFLPQSKSLTVR